MPWVIYKHTSPSGKCYIGQTLQKPEIRWGKGKNYSRAFKFGRAIDRYGWENFTHEILESNILTAEQANIREMYYIDLFDSYVNGYNSTKGGHDGEFLGNKVYQVGVDKKIIKVYPSAAEAERQTGILAQNIGACLLGTHITAGGYYWVNGSVDINTWNPAKSKKERPVLCVETKKVYSSITEASKNTGIGLSGIAKCAAREAISAGDLHWCYVDEYDESWTPVEAKQVGKGTIKAIICVETGEIYESITECSLCTGILTQNLSQNCCKAHRSAKGKHFAYLNEFDDDWKPAEIYSRERRIKVSTLKKRVYCLETDKFYDSASDAGRELGLDNRLISRCCKGELVQTNNKHFCYDIDFFEEWQPREKIQGQKGKNPIKCLETGEIFNTAAEATRNYGVNSSTLSACLNKKRETAGGYHWEYIVK